MLDDRTYEVMNLSEEKVVELLLSYRDRYDPYFFINRSDVTSMAVQGAIPLKTSVIELYSSLDVLIEKCKFDDVQKKIIYFINRGYNYNEIAKEIESSRNTVKNRLKTICKTIARENLNQWRRTMFVNILELKTKTCGKCKEELPATPEFFNGTEWSKDGYLSICRKCKQ